MNIVVCIKQVPASSDVKIDDKTGVILRNGVDSKMNPYDLYALEMALKLREFYGGSVDVLTMGPPQATEILNEALSIGADKGVLLSDKAFAGADVLATSYTVSQGIKAFGNYDLILCGKQTTDGDTAQVGAEIAEALDYDHATNIFKVEDIHNNTFRATMNLGNFIYVQKMFMPCVLTIEKEANVPRLPSYKRKCKIKPEQISVFSLKDFDDQNKNHYGLSGSPTSVVRVFPPDKNETRKMLEGSTKKMASEVINDIKNKKIIS